jgi:hypothetical protein
MGELESVRGPQVAAWKKKNDAALAKLSTEEKAAAFAQVNHQLDMPF